MLCYAGNEQAALDTAAACEALGAKAAAMRCDVSKTDEVKALVDAALQQFGAVHILVNNAGITRDGLLMTMKEDAWDQVLDTNLKGAFLTMKAVARTMMKQRYGRIVNLSSVVGLHGQRRTGKLRCQQSRRDRHDQIPGQGVGLQRRHSQRRCPRIY